MGFSRAGRRRAAWIPRLKTRGLRKSRRCGGLPFAFPKIFAENP